MEIVPVARPAGQRMMRPPQPSAPSDLSGPSDRYQPGMLALSPQQVALAELREIGARSARKSAQGGFFGFVASLMEPVVPTADKVRDRRHQLDLATRAANPEDREISVLLQRGQQRLKEAEEHLLQSRSYRERKNNDLSFHHDMKADRQVEQLDTLIALIVARIENGSAPPSEAGKFSVMQTAETLLNPQGQGIKLEGGHVVLPGARLKMRNPSA